MKLENYFFIFILFISFLGYSQNTTEKLDEIVITSSRIDLPFSKNSRTLKIITRKDIQNSTATNVADLLQQVAGIDVRRRGIDGMQSDLYIRGGSFDQTLILIDGFKTEDPQTGHHTMNMMIPLEDIERIEIIKGPAARIYGQNAFTGAINIVTKKASNSSVSISARAGSYNRKDVGVHFTDIFKKSSHQFHYSRNTSDGYRYNTDFDNQNYFLKSTFNPNKNPIEVLGILNERKFGANGFYASPSFTDQYEETQTSLIGVATTITNHNFILKPKVYWKRNQDMYVFLRNDPSFFRNLHISNKIGASLNTSYSSKFGITGVGVDIAKVSIVSNNLGNHNRTVITSFVEQRFKLLKDKLDVTPGIAINYFSDFKTHAFPGIDLGYTFSTNFKAYGNVGYTYRIPTYTDLFYKSPTTNGNPDLDPESAFAEELGFKYTRNNFRANVALFNRKSTDLIDYVKVNAADKWEPRNIRNVITQGFEVNLTYSYLIHNLVQDVELGYNFMNDNIHNIAIPFSRYSLNSIKHQVVVSYNSQFVSFLKQNVEYRFVERPDGTSYQVVDAKFMAVIKKIDLGITVNNIFNTVYSETNLVPMPLSNVVFSLNFNFN